MLDDKAKDTLEKIEEMLAQITKARNELTHYFGAEVLLAAETLVKFDRMENDIKQLKGQVLEYFV